MAYTARRHRLPSEASRRFERGVDDALAPVAAHAAAALLAELGGASGPVACTDVDRRAPRDVIVLDPRLPARLTGVDYGDAAVIRRLRDVGCDVDDAAGLRVTPPSWRSDLRRPVDLVEEVARLEGYDRLPVTVPRAPAGRGLSRRQRLRRSAVRALADAGYVEVLTYPFVAAEVATALLLDADDGRIPSVRVANPMSEQEPFLRPTLLPGLLAAVARNVRRGFNDLALYETGPVFRRPVDAGEPLRLPAGVRPSGEQLAALERTLPYQPHHLAVALTGARERPGWWGPGRDGSWADAVEAARTVASVLGVDVAVRADVHAPWHPGRCAVLEVDGSVVGHAGELHPRAVEAFGLPARTAAMELRLDALLDAAPPEAKAPPISAFPPAGFDLALVVDADTPAADVAAAVRAGAGPLLEDLRLFDVFTGAQVGEGRKSLAFALRLRAADRTLTADEAAAVRAAAVEAAARRCGATLRGA